MPTRQQLRQRKGRLAAAAILAGPFEASAIARALARLGPRLKPALWRLGTVIERQFAAPPEESGLAAFLQGNDGFRRAFAGLHPRLEDLPAPVMQPAVGQPRTWSVPPIHTAGELARWLDLDPAELRGLARQWRSDVGARPTRCQHYHHQWIPRHGRLPRLLEAPKARLKNCQHRILAGILAHIPVHDAAHGFVRGRDCRSHATPHVGRSCVLRMDVADFFPSLRRARVHAVFATAGYPRAIAGLLADLCTTRTPTSVRDQELGDVPPADARALRMLLAERHLPQGAPTSPALANLCAFRLDRRLHGLANRFGATYTRYADDLVFSGDDEFARSVSRCADRVAAVLLAEGLCAAHRKTRVLRRGNAQSVCGLIVNDRVSVPRRERERLESILYNCVRQGPATQNRNGVPDFRAWLLGHVARVSWLHPELGARLRGLFARIDWSPA